jgi:RNA polymerase primary sigma factor
VENSLVDEPLKVYLAELRKVPALGSEEEMDCVRHIRAGDEHAEPARLRLTEASLSLVVSIAERYQNDRIHILDLIQEGNNGLLDALQTFRDSSVDSFAVHTAPIIERIISVAVSRSSLQEETARQVP